MTAARLLVNAVTAVVAGSAACAPEGLRPVGVARVDITPDEPIRLAGYGARLTESEGVAQRLWAKAVAIGSDREGAAVLVSVENCGVPASLTEEVAQRLRTRCGIARERFVVCSTHIHSGPCLSGTIPAMFGRPIPAEHQSRIDRYTRRLVDDIERVAVAAMADRRPASLAWAEGRVNFAMNRRVVKDGKWRSFGTTPDGAVDHAMPILVATEPGGAVRAIVANYACHCTTIGPELNRICGDWAGFAQEYVEADLPGTTCLITIGCGADANPEPRTGLDLARRHGREMASEVARLLAGPLRPIRGPLACRYELIGLRYDAVPTREEFEKRANGTDLAAYHASLQLARLARGEDLAKDLLYPVQTWTMANELAMVFLAGEVVVDYALRLKRELDGRRLWVTAYANDVPCYIPSRRILAEGGYEVDTSMLLYGRPTRLAPEVEDRITDTVTRMVPPTFRATAP